jgi:nitric oxide reductase NorD protein
MRGIVLVTHFLRPWDLDIDALVRARSDLCAGSGELDRVHLAMRPQGHDLVVTLRKSG